MSKVSNYFKLAIILSLLFFGGKASALTVSPPVRELSGDPGKSISGIIKLYNENNDDMQFYASTVDFQAKDGEGGEPQFIEPDENEKASSSSLASWIKVSEEQINVKAQDWQNIAFEINIPENAEPGGHYAAIFFSPQKEEVGGPGAVGINYKTGSLILLSVSGETKQEGSVKEFSTKSGKTFYEYLPVEMELRIENSGNVHFKPRGDAEVRNMFGQKVTSLPVLKTNSGGNVLPGSVRRYDIVWGEEEEKNLPRGFFDKIKYEWKNFHLGRYTVRASVILPMDKNEARQISFWIIPWQLLIVIILVLIIVAFALRQYNKWIIKKAREGYKK